MPKKVSELLKYLVIAIFTYVGAIFGAGIDHEVLKSFLSETANSQIAQTGLFFMAASWIHSGRVKKEIKENFSSLTHAINNVAETLREDMKKHAGILANLDHRVQNLENQKKTGNNS